MALTSKFAPGPLSGEMGVILSVSESKIFNVYVGDWIVQALLAEDTLRHSKKPLSFHVLLRS